MTVETAPRRDEVTLPMDDTQAERVQTMIAPTGTRRAVLGLTAGGLAQATSGLLLPARSLDAAGQPVREEGRAKRRRRRRRHRRQVIEAAVSLALWQPLSMNDQPAPIYLDISTVLFRFSLSNTFAIVQEHGMYSIELFMTWSWSWPDSGVGVCETSLEIYSTTGEVSAYKETADMNAPLTTVHFLRHVHLRAGDIIRVTGQVTQGWSAGAQARILTGAMSAITIGH